MPRNLIGLDVIGPKFRSSASRAFGLPCQTLWSGSSPARRVEMNSEDFGNFPSGKPKWLSGAKQAFQGIQTGKSKQINLAVATLLIIRQLVLHHQKSNMFYLYSLRNSRPLKGSDWCFISVWTGRQIISCCWCSQRENKCRDEEMNEWQQCGKDAEESAGSWKLRVNVKGIKTCSLFHGQK